MTKFVHRRILPSKPVIFEARVTISVASCFFGFWAWRRGQILIRSMTYFTAKRNRELAPPRPQDGQRGPWVVEVLLLFSFPDPLLSLLNEVASYLPIGNKLFCWNNIELCLVRNFKSKLFLWIKLMLLCCFDHFAAQAFFRPDTRHYLRLWLSGTF